MALLPKIDVPLYDTILPSTKQKLKIRPFTVKEEKIVLLALSSDNDQDIEGATKQIINNCVVYPDKLNVDKLTTYDLEYLLLQLRARSVGETLTLTFRPIEESKCASCSKTTEVEIDLLNVEVTTFPEHTKKIQLRENLGIIMKDPTYGLMKEIRNARTTQEFDAVLKVVAKCIEQIFDDKQSYNAKDYTPAEFLDFVESLTKKEFTKIDQFFDTLPILRHIVNIDCKQCGNHREYVMEGLKDFLA